MLINYAAEKGLKLDESPKEVIEYIGSIDSEDIELTPELLATVSGGLISKRGQSKFAEWDYGKDHPNAS